MKLLIFLLVLITPFTIEVLAQESSCRDIVTKAYDKSHKEGYQEGYQKGFENGKRNALLVGSRSYGYIPLQPNVPTTAGRTASPIKYDLTEDGDIQLVWEHLIDPDQSNSEIDINQMKLVIPGVDGQSPKEFKISPVGSSQ